MRTDENLSFYERYLTIRQWVGRRPLEQGMVQTLVPPASNPASATGRRRTASRRRMRTPTQVPHSRRNPQLALELN